MLLQLQPQDVFAYFEEITAIPRGSGNMNPIRRYLQDFAKKYDINMICDKRGNVLMGKAGSPGREGEEPIILQGHMDMVHVKEDHVEIDFQNDPIQLEWNGDRITAAGTSLGADNGIAVAYMLAILSRVDISHPPLECIFTADEEVGLLGASELDVSHLRGRRMINLDSEEEGHILTSCAGGIKLEARFQADWEKKKGYAYAVTVHGLTGGHSGVEIDKGRGNANVLLARVIQRLLDAGADLVSFDGGTRDNVIPDSAKAVLLYHEPNSNKLKDMIYTARAELQKEFDLTDPGLELEIVYLGCQEIHVAEKEVRDKVIMYLRMCPNGVVAMSSAIPGLVETSLNMGLVRTTEYGFVIRHAMRSSVTSRKMELFHRLLAFAKYLGAETDSEGDYPPWEYKKDSPLREAMVKIYEEMYHTPMKVEMVHAGLECGYISDKIEGIDCVSIGPDIQNAHTTRESLSVSSTVKVWDFLLRVLESV